MDSGARTADADLAHVLHGKRVVKVSGGRAGQHCAHAIAGLGASVVSVRRSQPGQPGPLRLALDGHKEIVQLDPETQEGFEALVQLCVGCDLFIEDRPPLGWPGQGPLFSRLLERDPALLVVCLTPFGLTGPYADYAAYPLNCYHAGGSAQQIPCDFLRPQDKTRAPLQAGGSWGEAKAGTLAAVAAIACLLNPGRFKGTVIDCSKQEALISFNWTEVARYPNEGRAPSRLAPLATIVGGILPTQNGFVQIAVREDHQWTALANLLAHPEWADHPHLSSRAARICRPSDISHLLAAETVKFSSEHLHLRGRELGIPIAAVFSPSALLRDPDLAARGAWTQVDDAGVKLPRWDTSVRTAAAALLADPANARPAAARALPKGGSPNATHLPLQGLRVLDLGWVAMGPYAGYLLASLGAEVIHVGRPPAEDAGVDLSAYNYGFDTLNTGKTWVGIDMKSPAGLDLLHSLVAKSDVLLENFRPGVTRRLGIDFETLNAINPRLVMLSASTYGERAIGGAYVGYAPVFSALAGLAHFTGYPDGPPAEVSHPVDFFAGSVGIMGIVAGLHRLAATGLGCHIDLSAREAILWSLSNAMVELQTGQGDGRRLGNGHADMAPHGVYRCRGDNRWVSIAVGSDDEWRRLCACIGEPKLPEGMPSWTARERLAHRAALDQHIEQWTQRNELGDLFQRLQAAGVAAFPSFTSEDLWNDAHIKVRQIFMSRQSDGATRWYVGAPWSHLGQPRAALDTTLGMAAARVVFADVLGLSQGQIESLKAQGVIATR